MEWVHRYIADFGGDPFNVTLFGESSGAADILSHLSSNANQTRPLFHRAIVQSAIIDHNVPDVHCAGWYLSRVMSTLGVSTLDQLRILDAEKLAAIGHPLRVTYDGVFLLPGWRASLQGKESASRRQHLAESNLNTPARGLRPAPPCPAAARCAPAQFQPLIIGDSSNESLVWARLASCWTIAGVSRRLRAVCQSPSKAAMLLRGYSICEANPDDVAHRVLELINDTRVAWPTDCAAEMAKRERGGRHVWRYLFDQEGPARGIPHHAADLVYLFDNVPHSAFATCASPCLKRSYSDWIETSQDVEELKLKLEDHDGHEEYSLRPGDCAMHDKYDSDEDDWSMPHVDEWSFNRVRDAIQERWICFANGEAPWSEDSVFVFGPEGETGERPKSTLDERRRRDTWKTALEPLGMRLAQKVGMELSNGPSIGY
jgi:carboxylesterase type B